MLYRKELDGKCPFELIEKYIPIEILKKLHYERIPEENVTLIPELLGNKNIDNIKNDETSFIYIPGGMFSFIPLFGIISSVKV